MNTIAESVDINRLAEVSVPDDVFGYPSDNTLNQMLSYLEFLLLLITQLL